MILKKLIFLSISIFPLDAMAKQYLYDTVKVFTTDRIEPFVIVNQDKLEGLTGEFFNLSTKDYIKKIELNVLPWLRTQIEVNNFENAFIIPLARNKKREDNYRWIVEIAKDPICVFTYAGNKLIKTKEELFAVKTLGVVTGGSGIDALNSIQFPNEKLEYSSENALVVSKLKMERVEAIVGGKAILSLYWKRHGYDIKNLHCNMTLGTNLQSIAVSKNSTDKFVNDFTEIMNKFKETKKFKLLLKKYNLDE